MPALFPGEEERRSLGRREEKICCFPFGRERDLSNKKRGERG